MSKNQIPVDPTNNENLGTEVYKPDEAKTK